MTRYRPRTVLLLFMLLIFATPVVGQEAGQKARGEVAPGILDSVAPMSMVEGLLTPDLLQLEMEDGTIIARDDLIDPEYFVVDRAKTVLYSVAGMVSLAAGVEGLRSCGFTGTWSDGSDWGIECPGYSWLPVIGLGVGIGIPISFLEGMAEGEWKPW